MTSEGGGIGAGSGGGGGFGPGIPAGDGGDAPLDEFWDAARMESEVDFAEILEELGVGEKSEDKATKDAKKLVKTDGKDSKFIDEDSQASRQKFDNNSPQMQRLRQARQTYQQLQRSMGNQISSAGSRLQFLASMGLISLGDKAVSLPLQIPPSQGNDGSISVNMDYPSLQAPLLRENGQTIDAGQALKEANHETQKWFKSTFLMAFYDAMTLVNEMAKKMRAMNSELMLNMMEARYSSAKSEQAFMLAAAKLERKMAIMEFAGKIINGAMSIAGGVMGLAGGRLVGKSMNKQHKAAHKDATKAQAKADAYAGKKPPDAGKTVTTDRSAAKARQREKDQTIQNKEQRNVEKGKMKDEVRVAQRKRETLDTATAKHSQARAARKANDTPQTRSAEKSAKQEVRAARKDYQDHQQSSGLAKKVDTHSAKASESRAEANLKNPKKTEAEKADKQNGDAKFQERYNKNRLEQGEMRSQYMKLMPMIFQGFGMWGSSLGDLGKILWVVDKARWEGMAKIDGLMVSAWGDLIGALRGEDQELDKLIDTMTNAFEKAAETNTAVQRYQMS